LPEFRLSRRLCHKDADFPNPQPVLRAPQPAQAFDPATAGLSGFVPQMRIERHPNPGPNIRCQRSQILDRFRRQDNLKGHFREIIIETSCWILSSANAVHPEKVSG
jgi:hypothetical protein